VDGFEGSGGVSVAEAVASRWLTGLLRIAKYSPLFLQTIRGRKFRNPDTGNEVQFESLPLPEQVRIHEQWDSGRRQQLQQEAEKHKTENQWLPTNQDPQRYDHVDFHIRLDDDDKIAEKQRKDLAYMFLGKGKEYDEKAVRDEAMDLGGLSGIASLAERVNIRIFADEYEVAVEVTGGGTHGLQFERELKWEETGDEEQPLRPMHIRNAYFKVNENAPEGVATRMLATQVAAARDYGFDHIETRADRSASMNGYYTWPRLGFNAGISKHLMESLEDDLPEVAEEVRMLADEDETRNMYFEHDPVELYHLMMVPTARQWWLENGHTVDAVFSVTGDVDEGRSMDILQDYTIQKAAAQKQSIKEYVSRISSKKKPSMGPRLTKQDDVILDRVWDRALQKYKAQMKQKKKVARRWFRKIVAQERPRKPLVWLDTETTGFNPRKQEMISISMIDEDGKPMLKHPVTGEMVNELKITPQNLEEATQEALDINGYTEEKWKDSVPFADVAGQIAEIVKSHRMAGHNVQFDRGFIEADLEKAGRPARADPETVDTMSLSWLAGIPSNKLGVTTDQLGIELEDAHTAYADTEASRQVYLQLRDPKRVQQVRQEAQAQHGGPARGVMFAGMETSGNNPYKDDITKMAIVDHHGRTVFNSEIGDGEGKVSAADAAKEIADIYQDNMFGGDNPKRESDFVRSFLRKHGPKREDGKPSLGLYSPILDTATLRHVYGAGKEAKGDSLLDQAKAEAATFHEVADRAFGEGQPHRKDPPADFEEWAQGRSFRHVLSKDDPRRKKDFITFTTLKGMAEKGLGDGDKDVMEKAQKRLQQLQAQFKAWADRAQRYRENQT
jgi:DNA polymerase-3 subunit epsilon